MHKSRLITCVVVMMTAFFFCCFITSAESTSKEEEQTEVELPKTETPGIPETPKIPGVEVPNVLKKKKEETEDQKTDETEDEDQKQRKGDGDFSLSFPGDNKVQSLNLFFERYRNFSAFEFKIPKFKTIKSEGAKFELGGNYFLTFQKPELPSEGDLWETLLGSFSGWELLSRSYAFRLEGSTIDKIGVGGYIEVEGDKSIETDPILHTTLYGEWTPWSFIEIAFGGWWEVQQLGKELKCPENLSEEACLSFERVYGGLHGHIKFQYESNCIDSSVMFELLPNLGFDKYRFNVSPEIEIKLQDKKILFIDKFPFSIVIMGEFDYDSGNQYATIEPLIEINPWEIRWTQLVRYEY